MNKLSYGTYSVPGSADGQCSSRQGKTKILQNALHKESHGN